MFFPQWRGIGGIPAVLLAASCSIVTSLPRCVIIFPYACTFFWRLLTSEIFFLYTHMSTGVGVFVCVSGGE